MRSGVPQGTVIDPIVFLLFVNDLPDALEALTLLFADDVKMITWRTQNINLLSSGRRNGACRLTLLSAATSLDIDLSPIGLVIPHLCPN